ncbi:hypothetical protein OOJ09_12860 [Mesorhizobium qingshengii]|uniref:Large polyvalent protein associated domain-containing protein n=1 Tax=Mesorhizobium qingshengii TaxID=1165689 RepID=A0ABT4QU20_9HYPH|nr:hypothetical protein [Mesorhizobium qingshengii]MCZ8545077.1 hypothetical protein [Mesorhizobium qingshengii]
MFLYGTKFGDNPTYAPSYADTIGKENDQRAAAEALWTTTRDLALYRDNSNGEQNARAEAYDRRNRAIFDATGVQLDNPMKFDLFKLKAEPGAAGLPEPSARDDIAANEQAWRDKAAALAREKPEFASVIAIDRPVIEDAYALTRNAEQAAAAAETQADRAGLGRGRRAGNILGGGLAAALRDPLQVATLAAGGGISSPARALGWRLMETMFSEAAVNGGIEAAVQVSSHDWKKRAGVDASISTSLKQVGLAALFGGGFGGLLEGGREVGRLLGRDLPEEVLTRAASGNPEPGDFTTIADALGVKPDPGMVRAADLAAEQPALDAAAFGPPPAGLDEDHAAAMAAQALRAADSPDEVARAAIDRIVAQQSPVGPAPLRPVSLMQFLSSRSVGGIADQNGELAAMGLSRKFVPGGGALVRKNGKTLDYAREAAAEAGYFDHLYGDPQRAVAESTPDDLLRLLRQEAGGEPVFSARNDGGRQFAWLDYERQRAAQTAYRRLVEEVDSAASSLGIDHRLDDSVLVRAAELVDDKTSPVDALERALDEDYRNYADALSQRGEVAPDVHDIPFFEDSGTGPAAGRAAGEARGNGEPGGPGGTEAPGGGLSRAGGNEGESGLRAPGDTPEPATPEAGEIAELALTEARRPSTEKTAAGEQTLIEGVKPVSTKEKLEAKGNKPLRGGDAAPPEGGLFDLESRKQLSIWDALPAAKDADGTILHATHETMIADADRTEFFGDLIAACKD